MQLDGCILHHTYAMVHRKWILSLFFAVLSISSYAQMPDFEPLLSLKGESLFLDDIQLTDETRDSVFVAVLGEDYFRQWEKNLSYCDAGKHMLQASLGSVLIGGVFCFVASYQALDSFMSLLFYPNSSSGPDERSLQSISVLASIGYYFLAAGPLILATGSAFLIQGKTEMSRMVSSYNSNRPVSVTFGPTRSGNIGFALNF